MFSFMSTSAFKIRGHHLNNFASLASRESIPEDTGQNLAVALVNSVLDGPDGQTYVENVLGTSSSQRAQVTRNYTEVFKNFVELQSTDPIIITTGGADSICQSCIVGQHCHDRGLEFVIETEIGTRGIYEKDFGDMFYLDTFLRLGRALRDEGRMDPEFDEPVSCPEQSVQPSPAAIPVEVHQIAYHDPVIVQAGYVNIVLQHWVSISNFAFR